MNIKKKVAHIKDLVKELDFDKNKDEAKVISAIVDLLDDMSETVYDLDKWRDTTDELISDMAECVDDMADGLCELEDEVYGSDFEEDDGVFYEVTCPKCDESICVSEPMLLDGRLECPNCGELLEFDLDDVCCEDGCDCDETGECGCNSDH